MQEGLSRVFLSQKSVSVRCVDGRSVVSDADCLRLWDPFRDVMTSLENPRYGWRSQSVTDDLKGCEWENGGPEGTRCHPI